MGNRVKRAKTATIIGQKIAKLFRKMTIGRTNCVFWLSYTPRCYNCEANSAAIITLFPSF